MKEKRAQSGDQKRGRSLSPAAKAGDTKNQNLNLQQMQELDIRNAELGRQLHNL